MIILKGDSVSIKINEPYPASSIYSKYMIELKKMSDEELMDEYARLCETVSDPVSTIKKSIIVDFFVRFDKEYLFE